MPESSEHDTEAFKGGRRAYEDLPHSCGRCTNRWSGLNTCHCGGANGCHRTFTGVGHFDRHRRDGRCVDPATIGLHLVDGRAYEAWGTGGEHE